MPDSTPNQYLPPVVSGQAQSSSEINIITGTNGGTTDLGATDVVDTFFDFFALPGTVVAS